MSTSGVVCVDEGAVVHGETTSGGPLIIGNNCDIGPNCYIGPYASIGDNCVVRSAEIENTIIVGDCGIECAKRIVDSLIGRNTRITDSTSSLPRGSRFIVGENTFICL